MGEITGRWTGDVSEKVGVLKHGTKDKELVHTLTFIENSIVKRVDTLTPLRAVKIVGFSDIL